MKERKDVEDVGGRCVNVLGEEEEEEEEVEREDGVYTQK
jgi:hypothetical protein